MNAYDYIKKNLRENLSKKMIEWRSQESVTKLEKPTDIGRARKLGYKDKKGIVVARVRVIRGGRRRHRVNKGRKSKKQTARLTLKMNYQWVAEQRAAKKFVNLEVLNSYKVGKDGKHYFFEVILIDPESPEIKADPNLNWICRPENRGRVFHGLTSAGKKSRGLRHKGRELKVRPSITVWRKKGK
jgi:large subunit ribosomal protein L15e